MPAGAPFFSALLSFECFFGPSRFGDGAETVFPGNGLKKMICGDPARSVCRPGLLYDEYQPYCPLSEPFFADL
jgi:hypothetical protein